ncbi:MAG: hypothetical protein Q8P48_10800, partial [Deltaproteobacteria bacterium]|nr:hypothetical protein [Deltaproteobacteria bacterium]
AAGVGAGSSETLQARFKTIIENRLRDIRDELETLEVLVQPKELGGMSMSEENARRVLTLIEGKLKGVHEMHREAVKEKKSEWVAKEAEKAVARVESEKSAEAASRDAAYLQATSRSKKIASAPVPAPTPPQNLPVPSGNASAPVPHILPMPPRNPVPALAPSRAMTGGEIGTPQVMNQPPVSPIRPAMPVPAPKPMMKPVMNDVTSSASTATGPVEELRTTSVEDFRRLSKDPKEATLKIKDKIDLLGEESFTKRSQGIAAWNASGVFRLYLEMMGEALEGKPMTEVIASRQAEKRPCLTKEEIDAIVQLGTVLRA